MIEIHEYRILNPRLFVPWFCLLLFSCSEIPIRESTSRYNKIVSDLFAIEKKLQVYYTINGKFPKKGNTIARIPLDPWGNQYRFQELRNLTVFKVYTLGADQEPGGDGNDKDIRIFVIPYDEYRFDFLAFAIADEKRLTITLTQKAHEAGALLLATYEQLLLSNNLDFKNARIRSIKFKDLFIFYHKDENIEKIKRLAINNSRLVYQLYSDVERSSKKLAITGHFSSKLFLTIVRHYCQESYRIHFQRSEEFFIYAPSWWQESLCYYFPVILALNNVKLHFSGGQFVGERIESIRFR